VTHALPRLVWRPDPPEMKRCYKLYSGAYVRLYLMGPLSSECNVVYSRRGDKGRTRFSLS
jgi:hypothetical protein